MRRRYQLSEIRTVIGVHRCALSDRHPCGHSTADIEQDAETRAEVAVIGDERAVGVLGVVLVIPQADVEAQTGVQIPLVIDE